jgi:hypothetical protein
VLAAPRRGTHAALVALLVSMTAPAHALLVRGGGSVVNDCLLVFDAPANTPLAKPRHVRCTDGDSSCDADGVVNGRCQFAIGVCANSTFDVRCTSNGVQSVTVAHAADNGDRKFDTEFQALQTRIDGTVDPPSTDPDRCTVPTNLHVPVLGPFAGNVCQPGRKVLKIVTVSLPSGGKVRRDSDKIKLTCDPAPTGCDPQTFYDGTFDRIQRQIFSQRCAISPCHDSQSQQASLTLEAGSSYGALVDVTPTTTSVPVDWKRVLPGDSTRSFLLHKVNGDLAAGQGSRMPLVGPPLDAHLIDVIRLWIEAGAPDTGWVPGTEN